jgi:signal transduction histidine kinase
LVSGRAQGELALQAASEIEDLERQYAAVVALLDRAAAFHHATTLGRELLGVDVCLAGEVVDSVDTLVLRSFAGNRTGSLQDLEVPAGMGLGGKVAVLRHPIWVPSYTRAAGITHDFDVYVRDEGLEGLLAVPVMRGHQFFGVLYAAMRTPCMFGDKTVTAFLRIARQAGLAIDVAERAREMAEVAVEEERSRVALSLHDSVGAILFGIGASVRDLTRAMGEEDPLRGRLAFIEEQAVRASGALRQALRALSESPSEVALAVTLKRDCAAFTERTGIRTWVVALGDLPELSGACKAALLATAREALLNVEKHAHAASVAVSLFRTEGGVTVIIADDGVGFGDGEAGGRGLGLQATVDRLAQVGGKVLVIANEDGGTTVKAWVPC